MRRLPLLLIALLAALALGLAGCSGGDDDGGTPEPDAAAEAAYLAAIARDNERTVRTAAAVEHLCPDRQPVIDDPAAYLEE